MTDELRKIELASNPADDIDWCRERGHRAYVVGVLRGVFQPPGLLIVYGTGVVGVAEAGDTLIYDGELISIRIAKRS